MCGNLWREADGSETRMPRSSEQENFVHLPDVGRCYDESRRTWAMLCPVTDLFTRNLAGSPSQFVIDRKRGKCGRVMADPGTH